MVGTRSAALMWFVALGIGSCTTGGEDDPCRKTSTDPLECISFVPDATVVLDPRDYQAGPAYAFVGVRNNSLVELFVTPAGFEGDNSAALTTRDAVGIGLLPGKTLLLEVSYQAEPSYWKHGAYTAKLNLEVGWFDSKIRGPFAVLMREAADAYKPSTLQIDVSFDWDCDIDNDGAYAEVCIDGTDCNDQNATILPGGDELCDRADNDCNGEADDNASDARTFYADNDADGWGDAENSIEACQPPDANWVEVSGDCDDTLGTARPDATEQCGDGVDNDCDSIIDNDCGDTDPPVDSDTDVGETGRHSDTEQDTGDTGGAVTRTGAFAP